MNQNSMTISHIVGYNSNRVIGANGKMPWHHSDDLKYFKRVTMGSPIIMGRKTFDSIGRPLPGRLNIILSRSQDFAEKISHIDNTKVFSDLNAALAFCHSYIGPGESKKEVFIIGGGQLYADSLHLADKLYITHIYSEESGDTFYPEWDASSYTPTQTTKSEDGKLEWIVYEKRH